MCSLEGCPLLGGDKLGGLCPDHYLELVLQPLQRARTTKLLELAALDTRLHTLSQALRPDTTRTYLHDCRCGFSSTSALELSAHIDESKEEGREECGVKLDEVRLKVARNGAPRSHYGSTAPAPTLEGW